LVVRVATVALVASETRHRLAALVLLVASVALALLVAQQV
jgi:hypothetical protein